jgi:hypothetical protein
MQRLAITCAISIFAATSSFAQPTSATKPADVVTDSARAGKYELELSSEQGTIVAALELKRVSGKLEPTITVMGHSPALKSFTRESTHYNLLVSMGATDVAYKLRFVRDSVFGSYAMSGGMNSGGSVMGARKP